MSDTNAFIALHTINRKLRDSVSKEVADNYDKLIARIESLQQQNQKLTAALELARGGKGLGFYSDKGNWQLEMDRGFRQFTSMWPSDRTGNSERSFGGKHARQTEQEIKKILGEVE